MSAIGNNEIGANEPHEMVLCKRFDDKRMAKHSVELEMAGRSLNRAFEVSMAVSAMAWLVRANQVADDCEGRHFPQTMEDGLLAGITSISEMLTEDLERMADRIGDRLTALKVAK